jgi:dTDP-glucose 4,6-dehydratase
VGGGAERTNLQVVQSLCDLLDRLRPRTGGRSYREQIAFVADRPGHDLRYAIDPSRVRSELGWSPAHDFDAGIRQTVEWYLTHRDWCERITSGVYRRDRQGLGGKENTP